MKSIPGYTLNAPVCETGDLVIYRATRTLDNLSVLLKFPSAPHPTPTVLRRLEREYELARDLDSGLIARPIALERQGGNVALVLEQGPDRTLADQLGSPLDVRSFLQIAIGITAALAELHRHDLIHKDIKPEHVLLDAAGHVWLTGLGIASRLLRERQAPEPPEVIAGTLAYMAPEQTGRMNRSIDSRSDLYALGVTFYQMLTGVLPFTAGDPMELVHCHIARKPLPPSQLVASVPELVSEITMKLLAKTAEDRYQSTLGLEADLRECQAEWEANGCIAPFPLGVHDVTERLLIPEKLYGRQSEVDALLGAFDRVVTGGKIEFVLVSGYSGIGKTALVSELHKALIPPRGLFAAGKFDQYQRDIPYAPLIQALQTLIRQILGMSDTEMGGWRDALQKAVNPNGQLIVSLIPEVELIIGKQPPVLDVPPPEARNRFQMVLRRFLGVFAGPEHPLALFLDNLQWPDAATLDLIEQLVSGQEVGYLLLIGAYRDNEVGSFHPLMRVLDAIRKRGAGVQEIVLAPLTIDDVGGLVADSLHCDRDHALPLARLVHEKTGGNPFFTIQFLIALAEEKLLVFDSGSGCWIWDMVRILAKDYTDNVVNLMIGKLGRLPDETLTALKQFACMGNVAEIATLSMLHGQSVEALHAALWEAVRVGLVIRQRNVYTFLHDRVQEAAYTLTSEENRKQLHLKIGRLLFAHYSQEILAERVFDIVDQYNRSVELVTDAKERETLCRLNAEAGRRARASVAYASARRYFEQAVALLPADCWNELYAESMALFTELAECEYLLGNFRHADELLTLALEKARFLLDRALIYRLYQRLYQQSGRWTEAVGAALKGLKLLGVSFPESDEEIRLATKAEKNQIEVNLHGRRIADLADVPFTDDTEAQVLIGLLAESITQFFITRPVLWHLIVLKCVNLCLEKGHVEESSYIYSSYCKMLVALYNDIPSAFEFSLMSLKLNERSKGSFMKGLPPFFHASVVGNWRQHFETILPLFDKAFQAFLDSGDIIWASYLTYNEVWLHVENGDQLGQIIERARRHAAFNLQSHNNIVYLVVRIEEQFALSLQGKTRSPTDFNDSFFDEAASVAAIEQANFRIGMGYYRIIKQIAAFTAGQFDEALEWADRVVPVLDSVSSMAIWGTHYFYHALTLAALHGQVPARQQEFMGMLTEVLGRLKYWADNCPENFANRYNLVSAEIARIEGRDMDAMRLYDLAIGSARDNNFVQQEALAAEVASRFYRARGFDRIADAYLGDAHACYARWGADGKVRQLEQRYPQLRESPPLALSGTISTDAHELDTLAVVRASQAISGEILLDNLLKTLMRVVLENAGARQCYLLLSRNEELLLAAVARVEDQDVVMRLRSESGFPEAMLPSSILNYVSRSHEKVLLDDATSPNPYSVDEYFARQHPKSVLCFPIVRQTKLIGLLYLENDLTTHAFTPEHLAVLELLAAQAAIALENAELYSDLKNNIDALRQSEQKFRAIFDQTFQFIGVLTTDGIVLQVNQTALQFAGVSEDAVLGKPFWETPWWTHSAKLQQRLREAIQQAAAGKLVRFEASHLTTDGQLRFIDFSLKPVIDAEARVVQLIPEGRDITERKQAEDALRLSSERLQLATRVANIGIWDWDVVNNELLWDDSMYQLYGIRKGDFGGAYDAWLRTLHPEDKAHTDGEIQAALLGEHEYAPEFRIVRTDGTIRYIKADSRTIRDQAGKPLHMIGTNIDITERKQVEVTIRTLNQELEQRVAERTAQLESSNKELEAFSYSVSHDLRSPLRAIDGFCHILLDDYADKLDEEGKRLLNVVRDNTNRMGQLIDDILKFSRTGRLELSVAEIDMEKLARKVFEELQSSIDHGELQLEIAAIPPAKGDLALVRQVFVNLLSNAIKFTRRKEPAVIKVGGAVKGNEAIYFVQDNGAGFDIQYADKLFGVFQRLHSESEFEGTGIGLAIVKRIITRHGGRVWAEGKVNEGATIYFALPRSSAAELE